MMNEGFTMEIVKLSDRAKLYRRIFQLIEDFEEMVEDRKLPITIEVAIKCFEE